MPIFKGRWAAEPQIPEGLLHVDHRPVLVRDLHGLRRLLLLVLVGLRSGLVPGGLCPWRPGGGQAEGARCVCGQHQGLHLLLSLQPRNPAHNRVRKLFAVSVRNFLYQQQKQLALASIRQ